MRKRALSILFAIVLVATLMPAVQALASTTMYVDTSNGKSLNVRDYPSKDGNVIYTLPYGAEVTIDEGFVGSTWAHVELSGGDGYCMYRYLSDSQPGPKPNPTRTATPTQSSSLYTDFSRCDYTATVRPSSPGGFVHLRWAPSKNQPVQQDYYNGSTLRVIAQNGVWCQVYDEADQVAGFMMADFLVATN